VNAAIQILKTRITKMSNPFDYVNEILLTKKNSMRGSENDSLAESGYNPWLTNASLSYHDDTLLAANLLNQNAHLSKRAQYELLLSVVRPKKRQFKKWVKNTSNEDLDAVCEVYKCNKTIAKQYLSILSSDQIRILKESLITGGKE
jgi:hypothetical protein